MRAAKKGTKKYRNRRSRRRRGVLLFVVLLLVLIALPLLSKLPETVQRFTHPLPPEYEETIHAAAGENGVEPALVAAVIRTESRFDPEVVSSREAYGLMQIQSETASFIQSRSGIPGDYRDPKTNIRMGTWYLNYLQNLYNGDERLALAAYNSGAGQVDAWIPEGVFEAGNDIPFAETRDFVENVLQSRDVYTQLYGRNLDRHPEE